MLDKLKSLEERFEKLSASMADPAIVGDQAKYREAARSYSEIEPVVKKFREYGKASRELEQARVLVRETEDEEMRALAREEQAQLEERVHRLEEELKALLLPRDPNDEKNVLLEIRAGTGGEEAALFAHEVFRMYTRYAERRGWRTEILTHNATGLGGLKEVIVQISGDKVYSRLKFESGVHRVQRVPATEASGRIHTSAVTVAVLPEAEEVEVQIDEAKELRIDTFCSSGPGGQSVNTTYSAVRITHLPTGLVVQQQDEKSWHKNKAKALKVLRSRLYEIKMREQQDAIAKERRGMVGSGDRSEKIRTYNFPQNRVSDHRIGLTLHRLDAVIEGRSRRDPRRAHDALPVRAPQGRGQGLTSAGRRRGRGSAPPLPSGHSPRARRIGGRGGHFGERAMSIAESILAGERLLAAAGIPAPRLEAEVLLANRLGVPRGALIGRWHEALGEAAEEAYRGDLARRAARVPLQYITGRQEFFSLDFEVDERVLIPRPETEMIVEEVLRLAAAGGPGPPGGAGRGPLIVDVGTGSGCIAVAVAVNLPACEVLATDLSPGAVEVARGNAAKHGVGGRIRFAVGDGLAPALEAGFAGRADFVVSNPPYIAEAELEGLQAELRHEPRMALSPGQGRAGVHRGADRRCGARRPAGGEAPARAVDRPLARGLRPSRGGPVGRGRGAARPAGDPSHALRAAAGPGRPP